MVLCKAMLRRGKGIWGSNCGRRNFAMALVRVHSKEIGLSNDCDGFLLGFRMGRMNLL